MNVRFEELARQRLLVQRLNAQSFIIRFEMPLSCELTALLIAIKRAIKRDGHYADVVIGMDSLYVQAKRGMEFNSTDRLCVEQHIDALLAEDWSVKTAPSNTPPFIVKACYHPSLAPDLDNVAYEKKLSVAQVIALHTTHIYTVYAIGFMPGFAYMGYLPEALHIERKATPSLQVPAGAVGLAHNQTGIYPRNSPGGWQIIARTPLNCFDEQAPVEQACPFAVGQQVKFEAISLAEYRGLAGE